MTNNVVCAINNIVCTLGLPVFGDGRGGFKDRRVFRLFMVNKDVYRFIMVCAFLLPWVWFVRAGEEELSAAVCAIVMISDLPFSFYCCLRFVQSTACLAVSRRALSCVRG